MPTALPNNLLPRGQRLRTREVTIGNLRIGAEHPILVQSMTIADTCNTDAVVDEIRGLIESGCPLVRVTAPSIRDAENLREIKRRLKLDKLDVPLVADIHFTPNAALVAAEIVEKVRINPGNYADRKKFQVFEIGDREYELELERIRDRFLPLVRALKKNGTALRIGTNHGSLSDRIMNRYGDTPEGMVESALEFVRICENEGFREIVLSMKSSIPRVMIEAYRLLVLRMTDEGMNYPLHVGVTEAGNGLEGRIKSTIGIGSLLASGIGDTIRVSLTEDSEYEIPAAQSVLEAVLAQAPRHRLTPNPINLGEPSSSASRRETATWVIRQLEIGSKHPVRVELSVRFSDGKMVDPEATEQHLGGAGRSGGAELISVWGAVESPSLDLEATLESLRDRAGIVPLLLELPQPNVVAADMHRASRWIDGFGIPLPILDDGTVDLGIVRSVAKVAAETGKALRWRIRSGLDLTAREFTDCLADLRRECDALGTRSAFAIEPRIGWIDWTHLLASSLDLEPIFLLAPDSGASAPLSSGSVLCDGLGDSLCLLTSVEGPDVSLRWPPGGVSWEEDRVAMAYQILQACRVRLTKTEFIACPSCGRTQFDLQSTTAKIRARTGHLDGVKIAIMGCIVNGPGEMADADFGYVGSGVGKIDLYVGKDRVERNIAEENAEDRLIELLREHGVWRDVSPA